MKGVIYRFAPTATIVDITHEIPPQDIDRAAYEVQQVYWTFPAGTVHVAVVDPGVGTDRRPIALHMDDHFFVGPDNGVFSLVALRTFAMGTPNLRIELPDNSQGTVLDVARTGWREPSNTFHGRDLFAPMAAHLANGVPLADLGEPTDWLTDLPVRDANMVRAIDHFGNIITGVVVQPGMDYQVKIGDVTVRGLRRTYGEVEGMILVTSSGGLLEVAEVNGNAARRLGVSTGDSVTVTETRTP